MALFDKEPEYFYLWKANEDHDDFWGKRKKLVLEYSWAVPNRKALHAIKRLGPLLEVGAGNGYWAYELRRLGAFIVATDAAPREPLWTDVRKMTALAAVRHFPSRALLTVWPSYDQPWTSEMLAEYLRLGGRTVAYVGEHSGGCTGDDRFHELLAKHFPEGSAETVEIPVWPGLNDELLIYRR